MKSLIKICTNGKIKKLEYPDGKLIPLEEYQKQVGGNIETVSVGMDGVIMLVNEEGKLGTLPFNRMASFIYVDLLDYIVGDALLAKQTDDDIDGFSDEEAEKLLQRLDVFKWEIKK